MGLGPPSRRSILQFGGAITAGALAGCFTASGMTDVTIANETGDSVMVTVQATRLSDGKRLLDNAFRLNEGTTTKYEEVSSGSRIELHVSVQNGPQVTHEWGDDESDATGLFVDITTDSIEFAEAVR